MTRDPTHITVFSAKGKFIRQIFCMYLEQVPYPQQVNYLNRLAEVFQLDSGHIDNTNARLEQIGIDKSIYYLITLNRQNKQIYANDFAHMVKTSYSTESIEDHNKEYAYNLEYNPVYLEFLPNQRQLDQIILVNKELKSPRNKDGHGDAFISNAMALSWLKSNMTNSHTPRVIGTNRFADDDVSPEANFGRSLERMGNKTDKMQRMASGRRILHFNG